MCTSGRGLTVKKISSLVAEQPLSVVTSTVTRCPLVKVVVNMFVALASPWLILSTKNSYKVPPDAVKVTLSPVQIVLSSSLLLKPAVG